MALKIVSLTVSCGVHGLCIHTKGSMCNQNNLLPASISGPLFAPLTFMHITQWLTCSLYLLAACESFVIDLVMSRWVEVKASTCFGSLHLLAAWCQVVLDLWIN